MVERGLERGEVVDVDVEVGLEVDRARAAHDATDVQDRQLFHRSPPSLLSPPKTTAKPPPL